MRVLSSRPSRLALLVGVFLIAANLRGPVTGVGPVLDLLQQAFSLSSATAGLLTALPLLAFGLMAPLAPRLGQRHGLAMTLFAAMGLVLVGMLLRSSGALMALFAGTTLIGIGIAIGNVLLPAVIKRDFPQQVTTVTASYALTMGLGAALASWVAIPLTGFSGRGWDLALVAPAVITVVTLLLWWPRCRQERSQRATAPVPAAAVAAPPLWRQPLAWQVTLFFGLNSLVYYVMVSWQPAMLQEAGLSPQRSGDLHGVMQLGTALPALLLVPWLRRREDLRTAALSMSSLSLIGLLGLALAPQWALAWSFSYGFGTGAGIILALSCVSLRSGSVQTAARLSGMAQCIGYLLAAAGPTLAGALHDHLGHWQPVLWLALGVILLQGTMGWLAGGLRRLPEASDHMEDRRH